MKFHCDRCKTRYSIGDDRVRGKILKIRCKNCSAVITVREEMADGAEPGADTPAPTEAASEDRASTSAASPRSLAAGASGSALRGAFRQVFERPVDVGDEPSPSPSDSFRTTPPDHFEQEWYVAVEGDQHGPFALEDAKSWVAEQDRDTEIFCWNEDFDDWLPVEKVSHFRGLRASAPSAPARPSTPASAHPPLPIDEPPSAHSALAAVAAEADSGVFRGPDILSEETPKPLFAPTFAALEAEQKARRESHGERAPSQEAEAALGDTVRDRPASGDLASPAAAVPPVPAPRVPTDPRAASPVSAAIAAALPDESGAIAAMGNGAAAGDVPADGARPESDFDLDIGEASRVVKVPMLDVPGRTGAVADGGLPGVANIRKGTALGVGTGPESAIPPLAPLSEAALADARPGVLTATAKRRHSLVLPVIIGVAVIAVVLGVLLALMREGDDDDPLARSKLAGDELAHRPGGPERVRVVTREVEKVGDDKTRRPTRNNRNGNGVENGAADGGAGELAQGDDSQRPLTPADVIRASRENGLGNKRCYERALKKDPFLDVKKIKVTLSVAPSGVVTDLKMDSYANTFLGECLASRIRKWPFRKSSKGITTELTLSFEQL